MKFVQAVDSYFYLGGKKALVISKEVNEQSQGVLLYDSMSSLMGTCLKVISYCTLIFPFLVFLAKFALRSLHKFHLIDIQEHLEEGIEISQETHQQALSVLNGEENNVIFYAKREDLLIFTLDVSPGLVFKTIPLGKEEVFCSNGSPKVQIESNQWIQLCFDRLLFNREQALHVNKQDSSPIQVKLIEVADRLVIVEKQEATGENQGLLDGENLAFVIQRAIIRLNNSFR